MTRVSVFLTVAVLIVGMAGCGTPSPCPTPLPSQNLEIRTWYDLDAVRDNLAGNHTLMNDLDSTTPGYIELASPAANGGKGWDPIGYVIPECPFGGFTGTFDGQGYGIRVLFINRPDESVVGLFKHIDEEGVIKDIGVTNITVIGERSIGSLVGINRRGTISDCHATGNVTGDDYVGGLVGVNSGTVGNSYFSGSVTGGLSIGGLVGYGGLGVGGLVGWNNGGSVSNSYSSGSVSGRSVSGNSSVGGLVGDNVFATVSNSYSTGSVTGNGSVGGLVGSSYEGTASFSFWDTQTSGQATSAGGTGETTAEMQDIATFSGAAWNIIAVANPGTRNTSYIWNMVDSVTYPFLSWQP